MKSRIRSTGGLVLFAAVFGLYLAGCGNTPVCIGGVGDCGWDPKLPTPTGTQGSGTSNVVAHADITSIVVGDPIGVRLFASGGTAPYTYNITSPLPAAQAGAQIKGAYFIPPPNQVQGGFLNFTLQAVDSRNNHSNYFYIKAKNSD